MILKSSDIISFVRILDAIDRINNYSENLSEDFIINDNKTIDAITFNLKNIGEEAHLISDEFRKIFSEIDWFGFKLLGFGGYDTLFSEKDFPSILFDDDTGLVSNYKIYQKCKNEFDDYFNSTELLYQKMSIKKFFSWKNSDGEIYIKSWVRILNEHYDKSIKSANISKAKILEAWEYHDLNTSIQNNIITNKKGDIDNHSFSILDYRKAIEIIISDSLNNPPVFKNSSPTFGKIKKAKNEELPWCTDYSYAIKTSNSIWTVRNKSKRR